MLEALGTELERREIMYGSIESEQLSQGWPLLDAAVWTRALAAVLALQRAAGRTLFVVAATTEDAAQLDAVVAAAAADRTLVVALSAPPDVVAARLEAREPDTWPGKRRLVAHARALAETLPRLARVDVVMETVGRDPREVATEVMSLLL